MSIETPKHHQAPISAIVRPQLQDKSYISGKRTLGGIIHVQLCNQKHVLTFFTSIKISHVYREASRVADGLARLGFDVDGGLIIYDHAPKVTKPLVAADCLGVSTPRLILCNLSSGVNPF